MRAYRGRAWLGFGSWKPLAPRSRCWPPMRATPDKGARRVDSARSAAGRSIHLAGTIEYAPAARVRAESVAWHALRAKAEGAWLLHTATLNGIDQLRVISSSVAAILGGASQAGISGGQWLPRCAGALCTACADCMPALSINWGSWQGASMMGAAGKASRTVPSNAVAFSPWHRGRRSTRFWAARWRAMQVRRSLRRTIEWSRLAAVVDSAALAGCA